MLSHLYRKSCCGDKMILWPIYLHDDIIKWKLFLHYWPFAWGIHRSPVNSPHKGQWRGALMFSLICAWINGWVSDLEAGDLRCHGTHYDVIVMSTMGFPLLVRWHLYIESGPRFPGKAHSFPQQLVINEMKFNQTEFSPLTPTKPIPYNDLHAMLSSVSCPGYDWQVWLPRSGTKCLSTSYLPTAPPGSALD